MTRVPWHEYGLALAEVAALRSEDPYRRVGAVVFRWDWSVLSIGYNGAPPGVELDWSDRAARRDVVIHAEMNALRYVSRMESQGGFMCTTTQPCEKCLPMIAAYGLTSVFYREAYSHDDMDSRRLGIIADILGLRTAHIPKEHDGHREDVRATGATAGRLVQDNTMAIEWRGETKLRRSDVVRLARRDF